MLEKIKTKINEGYYDNKLEYPRKNETMKEGYITDENKSVIWNREQVTKNIEEFKSKVDAYHNEGVRVSKLFEEDVINYIMKEFHITEPASKFLLSEAWEKGHPDGLNNVIEELSDLIEFIIDFDKLNKEG